MGIYRECDKCGNLTIEIIGDRELGCEYCLNQEEIDDQDDNCEICGKPFNSPYHISDECVNLPESEEDLSLEIERHRQNIEVSEEDLTKEQEDYLLEEAREEE